MRTALLATAASAVAASNSFDRQVYEREFFEHMNKFNLQFKDGEEFVRRLQVFSDNYDMIQEHNKGQHTFTLGLNQFSHLTLAEFHDAVHLGGVRPPNLRRNPSGPVHTAPANLSEIPAAIDHVANGAVTDVKNQGSCGSCWAFSTVGALESAYYLKYGKLLVFSEQELVSCDNVDLGCNGGWMDDAFTWVKGNGGLTTADQYPYSSASGTTGTCKTSGYTNIPEVAPQSFTDVAAGSVDALASALAKQPVSIAIQANQLAFQSYSGGVLSGVRCGQRLDHGVLAVGYGTDNGIDYWKVKNSWGTSWGEGGYIRIEKSSADLCGVLDAASYPNL